MGNKQATREAYGKVLVELGKENPNLIVMDADLSGSTKTGEFAKVYPERFFNMGIAEQNLYASAAGIALSGKVVCASTFAMFAAGRAFEIIRNSIGYTSANVKICATHAGITVGEDGASHQTFEDLALMRTIPGMTVINPCDGVSAEKLIRQAVAFDGPAYIRLGRASVPIFYNENDEIELGKAKVLKEGKDLTQVKYIIGTGGALTRLPHRVDIMKKIAPYNESGMLLFPSEHAQILVDNDYIMASLGVLSTRYREAAIKLLEKSLDMKFPEKKDEKFTSAAMALKEAEIAVEEKDHAEEERREHIRQMEKLGYDMSAYKNDDPTSNGDDEGVKGKWTDKE